MKYMNAYIIKMSQIPELEQNDLKYNWYVNGYYILWNANHFIVIKFNQRYVNDVNHYVSFYANTISNQLLRNKTK